jgi:hypothetical protein
MLLAAGFDLQSWFEQQAAASRKAWHTGSGVA